MNADPQTSVKRQTAFVTGAAQGLGAAIAEQLFRSGRNVVLTDIDPAVDDAAKTIDPSGGSVLALPLDVRDESAFQRAFDAAITQFGAVDIMVNNAARTAIRSLWEITPEEWDDVLAINLRGTFFGCRIAGAHMRERRGGRIINLSSIAGQQGSLATGSHYAASKAGILVLTKIFAQELAPFSVTVNAIAPSAISGPAVASAPPEKIAAILDSVPLGRLGDPGEVAAAVLYLASDGAGYTTGATLDINGGRLMR
jgi:3-oxoacyl-[acyl-carrier protein] reductase